MIRNSTRRTCIAKNPVMLTSCFGHALGLMFKREITPHVLLFRNERRVSLHTFFVAGHIDVIFVNAQGRVCEIKENFAPFSFYTPHTRARYVIEAAAGVVRRTKTRLNDIIHISVTIHV